MQIQPKKLPLWKLKREIHRLWMQSGIPYELLKMPTYRWLYDRKKHKATRYSSGIQPLRKNVAIVLIFQPNGICNSLLETLRYMNENDFSPLVVSNSPLSSSDLESLREHAHLILERPNSGYDFGGYRDGVLHLLDKGIYPENLVLLNDSVWFPVKKNCNFLEQVKNERADLFGIVYSERVGKPNKAHLQSYFYNFKKDLIQDPSFRRFWEKMFFSNNKFLVIRLCEMKLTQYFKSRGFSVAWLYNHESLDNALKSLSKSEFKMIVKYQMQVDEKHSEILAEVLNSKLIGDDWRQEIKRLIENKTLGTYILIAHPFILFSRLNIPILKKDKQDIYQMQREAFMNIDLDAITTPIVNEEIRKKRELR